MSFCTSFELFFSFLLRIEIKIMSEEKNLIITFFLCLSASVITQIVFVTTLSKIIRTFDLQEISIHLREKVFTKNKSTFYRNSHTPTSIRRRGVIWVWNSDFPGRAFEFALVLFVFSFAFG